LLANVSIRARVEEILAAGAERAEITVEQVLRELAVLGFSDIGKVVRWRPELVYEELEDADNLDQPVRQVLQSRVLVIDSATLLPEARLAVAEVSQTANGLRVKMHDKHGPLVSIGKHLGMFVDQVQVRARYAISDQPMSAEEWKKQYVKEG
jgi:phage terminase small subunit